MPSTAADQARTGFDRLFDFDGVAAGDRFTLAKGSTAGPFAIKGEAKMLEFTPTHAKLWGKGGRFGIVREVTIEIDQISPTRAMVQSTIKGVKPFDAVEVEIVEQRKNFVQFQPVNLRGQKAVVQTDFLGRLVVDLEGMLAPIDVHLVLEDAKRSVDALTPAPAATA